MMNLDAQLKLQAYLDGELPERERADVESWLAKDTEAQALLTELRNTSAALAGQEAGIKLPESREFFWSKIQREITRQEQPVARPVVELSWMAWMMQRLAPLGTVTALAALMILWLARPGTPAAFGEMEVASDSMGAYTFRDQEARMTVVWFYDREPNSQFTPAPVFASIEPQR
jgi:anti-sigma factor RsiW